MVTDPYIHLDPCIDYNGITSTYCPNRTKEVKANRRKEAKLAKRTNPDESMYKTIEEDILDMIHMRGLYLISSIVGLILIALGTVALCAVLLL